MPPKAAPRRAPARRKDPAAESSTTPAPAAEPSNQNVPESRSTPGPGPSARPGVQRLQSLKKRAPPSGSIAASAKPSALAGEPSKPTLKYQPRAVGRRSKEEREAMEKLEAERHRERLAEAAAKQRGRGGAMRGRGGFGRGRGGPLGADVGGPFGSGMAGRRGRGARFTGDSRQSSISRRSHTRSIIDAGSREDTAADVSSDESDAGLRMSIDQINIESEDEFDDDDDVDVKGKVPVKHMARDREKGLRPIRVERHEHEERVVSVNMESSSKKSAELREQAKLTQDNSLFVEDDTTAAAKEEPRVKLEPKDEDETMAETIPHVADDSMITDDGFLPEQAVKVRSKLIMEQEKQREREQPPPAIADPRSLLRTKEDIEEFDRHAQDLEAIKELLSVEMKEPGEQPPVVADTEKPEDAEDAAEEEDLSKDKLSGQLFLMQFPPMTPNLIVPGSDGGGGPEGGESTVTTTETGPDGTAIGQTTVKREDGSKEVIDVEGGAGEISDQQQQQQEEQQPKVVTATDWRLGAGRVGKLNVHASGRVTMDWGGISLEVDRATAVEFLQEALIVSGDEALEEERRVWAMGQLSGKFTVTPDWGEML